MTRVLIIMGLIATILNLFGCSRQNKNSDDTHSNEMEDRIEQSIEAFKNRTIYKELASQNIDSTDDGDLLQVIFDNLSEKLPSDYEKEYQTVMKWNKSRQAVYMIWILEAEVNNGGYNQFYFNSSGQFYQHLPDALKLVGALKFANLTMRANEIFAKEYKKITEHQDGTLGGFSQSYEDNPLNDLDDEFYKLYESENLQQIQIDFILKNKQDFVDLK